MWLLRFLTIASFLFLSTMSLWSQSAVSSGTLSGQVRDVSGAVIPNVQISATNVATKVKYAAKTNNDGLYRFPPLPVGAYDVTFTQDKFQTSQVQNVELSVGRTTTVSPELQVGQVSQQVTVEAAGSLLHPTDSSQSTVVDQQLISDLPLNGRRYTDFVLLTPNVTADGQFGLVSIAGQQGGGDSGYANGNGSNSFTLDGANATSSFYGDARGRTRVPYVFGEQSIQEFQVADNPYSASYGGAGSGFVNTVTKSGGNDFHGDAFYYNRNSGTGANDSIDKANGRPKPLDVLQQFGADLGGPLVRQKLFFYFDYEQQREKDPISVINVGQESLDVTSFGLPAGTVLPAPNAAFPVPSGVRTPDPLNPTYLQQVSNALNVIQSNIGQRQRRRDDLSFFPKIDWHVSDSDQLSFVYNYNTFNSPGGEITFNPVSSDGIQALSNNAVRDHHATIHWTHILSPNLVNDVHASYLRDEQIESPSGLVDPSFPSMSIFSPQFFALGNPGFSLGDTREYQWEFNDRVNWVVGRNTIDFGVDFNYDQIKDFAYGNFRGTFGFPNPTDFALGHYSFFSQNGGTPTFQFSAPYLGFYADDKFQATSKLTLDFGLREDFQIFPQPVGNPAIPLTGQFPNRYRRLSPRFGFAYQPASKTVVRGGFGIFYEIFNGINYENSVISNGLPTQQSSAFIPFNATLAPNQQAPVFPNRVGDPNLFSPSSNVSIVSPGLHVPYVLQGSFQIEQELSPNTTFSIGTMWTHAVHLIASSAYDLNLQRPTGTTQYVVCPPGTLTTPCAGPSLFAPNLDAGLLTEGAINPNAGQINALISPGLNNYNSLFVQFKRRATHGLELLTSYTWSKNIDSNGVDFNNQFDFSNTHSPSLLDQEQRLSVAAVWQPQTSGVSSRFAKALLSNWTLSTVMAFNSGRPYSPLLNSSCTGINLSSCNGANNNLNDSAFNETTGNTAVGINGAGPSPNFGLNSFYGPWIEEVDLGLERKFHITERHVISFKAQAFNIANHANFFVQNGSGINQTQYNPVGPTCGDGSTLRQTCYLIPNTGPGNFQTLESIGQLNGPRVFQFSFGYSF
ncbi:MAG: carboxypeptidase regulatory-like domain-containing protein [Acidobacteriota bacterium]|nr:carboxypeptidase regulatory-like domain-containing protein [Acidobacteriota bacterium]